MPATQVIKDDIQHIIEEIGEPLRAAFKDRTILVTGASGFLCSYLVDVLAEMNLRHADQNTHIIAIDNGVTGEFSRLSHLLDRSDVEFIQHDITQPWEPTRDTIDYIVHGASIASPMVYRQYPLETLDANVGGTRLMLELARSHGTKGMLVMSTSEIYGDPAPEMIPTPESYRGNVSCFGPRACYDESKRLAETLSWIYASKYDVPVKLIRPFNVFGPGLRLDDKRVLPDFMTCVLEGTPIELLSDGKPTRAFCYVTDAIRGMFLVLMSERTGEPFNVGNDEGEISMGDLAKEVASVGAAVLGGEPLSVTMAESEDKDYLVDNPNRRCPDLTKLRGVSGWTPKISVRAGLERLLRSYVEERSA